VGETTVTELLDQPLAPGATLYPHPPPVVPGLQAAEDFYSHGPGVPSRHIAIQVLDPGGSLRRTWLASHMEQQVNDLLRLRSGWDGDRALPITDEAAGSAISLLFVIASDLSLPPQVFPLPDGGLQMEWHAGRSVEIEIDAEGDAHVLITGESGELVANEELTSENEVLLARTREAIEDMSIALTRSR
jgi:hypothetical protein